MNSRFFAFLFLAAALAFAGWIHLTHLDWGLPNPEKTLQVMGGSPELDRWIPIMIEQRKKYYEGVEKLLDASQPFQESYRNISARWEVSFYSTLPWDVVLDRLRNYLIGANVSDEQYTLSAIRGLNPAQLDFTPGAQAYYGGFYYYSAAGMLLAGKIFGRVSLNPHVEHYFAHPEDTLEMYRWIRALGGISVLAALVTVFVLLRKSYGWGAAGAGALLFAGFPLMVPLSHLAKTHLYGMFWLTLGLYFCAKIIAQGPGSRRLFPLAAAGLALGLCAGCLITNLSVGILLFASVWGREDWDLLRALKDRFFWIAAAISLGAFAATNFYVFLRFSQFQRLIRAMNEFFPAFTSVELNQWAPYLREFFREQVHPLDGLLLLWSGWMTWKRREPFILVCWIGILVLFLQNLVLMRHPPVNARLLPLWTVIAAWGVAAGWQERGRIGKGILAAVLGAAVFFSWTQSAYYSRLHRTPSNLDAAGAWINANVPEGSTIGAWGGGFAPFDFPPIRFLRYSMIALPHPQSLDAEAPPPDRLPGYLLLVHRPPEERIGTLEKFYRPLQSWPAPAAPLGLNFSSEWVKTGNWDIVLLKKGSS